MVRVLSLAAAVVLTAGCFANAADLAIGDKAPTFKDLTGADGKTYSSESFKDAKVVVIVFTCNGCPTAIAYEDRIAELAKKYKDKGVAVVAINPKSNDGEGLEGVKKRAEEKGYDFPYCFESSQDTARAFGAKVTPHFFVLDKDRTVQYMGALDNSQDAPSTPYLANAVDALLAGKKPEKAVTKEFGCGIGIKKAAAK